jgi:alkylated DNA nucleotide flippase Atl1
MGTGPGDDGEHDVLQGAPLIMRAAGGAWSVPTTSVWEDERSLQQILSENPTLLPGVTSPSTVTVQEFPIYGSGRVDILAIEPDGSITLCEVKLRRNPEIRRQVIGQVLAYAAGLTAMTYEEVDREVSARSEHDSLPKTVLGSDADPGDLASFVASVTARLRRGRFRLVLAVDELTDELRATIDFLATHTDAEMELVAIEVAYARTGDVEVLVPRVFGAASAPKRSTKPAAASTRVPLDEAGPIIDAAELAHTGAGAMVRRLLDDLEPVLSYLYVGNGDLRSDQGCVVVADSPVRTQPLAIRPALSSPGIRICFDWMRRLGDDRLQELLTALERNPSLEPFLSDVQTAQFRKRPLIPFSSLAEPGALDVTIASISRALRPVDGDEEIEPITSGGFDADLVHSIMKAIPIGRWTTYGEIAQMTGTGAKGIGNHLRTCPDCPNAARVLPASGEPSPGFKRTDPDDLRTQREQLESEGVRFVESSADPSQRVDVAELAQLIRDHT